MTEPITLPSNWRPGEAQYIDSADDGFDRGALEGAAVSPVEGCVDLTAAEVVAGSTTETAQRIECGPGRVTAATTPAVTALTVLICTAGQISGG